MRIVIAPNPFKESLSSLEAARAIDRGWKRAFPNCISDIIGLADGGEGTLEVVFAARGGQMHSSKVHDPLLRPVTASFLLLDSGNEAVVELAQASGLTRLTGKERNPAVTTTLGTGELIHQALDSGARRLTVALGGSATNDAGSGILRALGARFLDRSGSELPHGGLALKDLDRIDTSRLDSRLAETEIEVLCDVDNPLTGPSGASMTYGPQKGGSPRVCAELDSAMSHFADVVSRDLGVDLRTIPGAGAAGGSAAGLLTLPHAKLMSGFATLARLVGLEARLERADLVLTGEGEVSSQTGMGKGPGELTRRAREKGISTILFCGKAGPGHDAILAEGKVAVVPIADGPLMLEESLLRAAELLEAAAYRAGINVAIGLGLSTYQNKA